MIKLVHREQGIGGVFTQCGDQAGVIHGAVMIDVVGTERGAGEALEEIVLFVRGAIGADEADGISAVLGVKFL